jgi:hypothetical protein
MNIDEKPKINRSINALNYLKKSVGVWSPNPLQTLHPKVGPKLEEL